MLPRIPILDIIDFLSPFYIIRCGSHLLRHVDVAIHTITRITSLLYVLMVHCYNATVLPD